MVNTFLPYDSYTRCAKSLDSKRLNKQIVECKQIIHVHLGVLTKKGTITKGYKNHPATKMWKDNLDSLLIYYQACIDEWVSRGGKASNYMPIEPVFLNGKSYIGYYPWPESERILIEYKNKAPFWLGNSKLHESHRSNLLRKDRQFYSQFNWECSDDLPYYWPME